MGEKIIVNVDGVDVELDKDDLETRTFDAADFLDSDEVIAAYLSLSLEEDDPAEFIQALNTAARAKGMLQIAKDTGLARESIYKTLSGNTKPRFETILKIVDSLGVKFTVEPKAPQYS